MEHRSAVNRKEVLMHTWRTPKNTVSDFISFIGKTLNRQVHRDRKQVSGCQGLRAGGSGSDWGFRASFRVMEMFWDYRVNMVAQHCEWTKCP